MNCGFRLPRSADQAITLNSWRCALGFFAQALRLCDQAHICKREADTLASELE
jgi:hypothetical protein